jgi:outer membrane protein TolC
MASKLIEIAFALILMLALGEVGRGQTTLSLPEAIRLAEAHSLNLGSLKHDSLAARFDLAAAKALRFPTLSATGVSYYTDEIQRIELPFNTIELGSHENYQADFRLAFPLYAGGRISSQIGMQSSLADLRGYNLAAGRLQNAYQARRAYFGLMLAISGAAAAEASLRRVEVLNMDVSNLYNSGLADSVDILDSQLAFERAQRIHSERLTAVENALSLLTRLTGLVRAEIIINDEALPAPNFETYENAGAIPEKINRPELAAFESKAVTARHGVGLSRAGYLPSLNAFGGYTVGKPGRDIVNKDWNDYWTVGLNLNWEFNLGMRASRNVSSSREGARAVELARDDLEESILLGARVAYDNLKQAYQNYAVSLREYRIAERKYALGSERQRAGTLSVNRLIELEADLAAAEQLHRSAIINYYMADTEYLYAIGSNRIYGGF